MADEPQSVTLEELADAALRVLIESAPTADPRTPGLDAALAWAAGQTHHPHIRVLYEEVCRLSGVKACECP
jgi:hypothetical protein